MIKKDKKITKVIYTDEDEEKKYKEKPKHPKKDDLKIKRK